MKNVVILASGRGSNADNICAFFKEDASVNIALIITNKSTAGVINVARNHNVVYKVISNAEVENGEILINLCNEVKADLVVLAGFLRKLPKSFINEYSGKIINVHPALLPKYGGKGMYGVRVHEAVKNNNERLTGITIHYVNEVYDDGKIILQASCPLSIEDTVEDIAKKVHQLEYQYFPIAIDQLLKEVDDL